MNAEANIEESTTDTALIVPQGRDLREVFKMAGEPKKIVDAIKEATRSQAFDPDTEKGRKEIRSWNYKIARSKTLLDDTGKKLGEAAKKVVDALNADRKYIRDELEALQAEVLKPAVEAEEREERRRAAIKARIEEIRDLGHVPIGASSGEIQARLDALEEIDPNGFGEFEEIAKPLHRDVSAQLADCLGSALQAEADAAELAALRAEREQRDREAAERAEREAAEKAEREMAERREREAKEKAAREAKEAEERKAREAQLVKEAAEKAAREERERLEAMQRRAQEEKEAREKAAREAEEKRQANARHRAAVKKAAVQGLQDALNIGEPACQKLFEAIKDGQVPHVTIVY